MGLDVELVDSGEEMEVEMGLDLVEANCLKRKKT